MLTTMASIISRKKVWHLCVDIQSLTKASYYLRLENVLLLFFISYKDTSYLLLGTFWGSWDRTIWWHIQKRIFFALASFGELISPTFEPFIAADAHYNSSLSFYIQHTSTLLVLALAKKVTLLSSLTTFQSAKIVRTVLLNSECLWLEGQRRYSTSRIIDVFHCTLLLCLSRSRWKPHSGRSNGVKMYAYHCRILRFHGTRQ